MAAIHKLAGNFTETDIDEEIIIMRLDNGDLFTLDGTAAAIWRLIDGRRDLGALLAALATEFTTDEQHVAAEVGDFLSQLKEARLVAEG